MHKCELFAFPDQIVLIIPCFLEKKKRSPNHYRMRVDESFMHVILLAKGPIRNDVLYH